MRESAIGSLFHLASRQGEIGRKNYIRKGLDLFNTLAWGYFLQLSQVSCVYCACTNCKIPGNNQIGPPRHLPRYITRIRSILTRFLALGVFNTTSKNLHTQHDQTGFNLEDKSPIWTRTRTTEYILAFSQDFLPRLTTVDPLKPLELFLVGHSKESSNSWDSIRLL